MFLTVQQRGMLREATRRSIVTAETFAGAIKHWEHFGRHTVTSNSAQKALKRLADRGLLSRLDPRIHRPRAVYRITDAGRDAIA